MKSFDEDLVQTFETLEKDPAVQTALKAVVDRMPDIIEVQKALTLIEAPTRHEEKKARRYAEHARLPLSVTATAVTPSPPGKEFGCARSGGAPLRSPRFA